MITTLICQQTTSRKKTHNLLPSEIACTWKHKPFIKLWLIKPFVDSPVYVILYYIILYYIILYYIILYYIILYYIILYYIILYYIILYHIRAYYIILLYYNIIYRLFINEDNKLWTNKLTRIKSTEMFLSLILIHDHICVCISSIDDMWVGYITSSSSILLCMFIC